MAGSLPDREDAVTYRWERERAPTTWDEDKERVIGGAPEGAFVLPFEEGDELPGEWWHVRDDDTDRIVGYGRLDTTGLGDAEILLASDPDRQGEGIGSFILQRLEDEAAGRGFNYVHNVIRPHGAREQVHEWLTAHGFVGSDEGELRKRVRSTATADHQLRREARPR